MIKNTVIIILTVLLGICSYILYENKSITINFDNNTNNETIYQSVDETVITSDFSDPEILGTLSAEDWVEPDINESVQSLESGFEPEIFLDPTLGITINEESEIVSRYRVIGPKKFSLLDENDEAMVEIDLDTGLIKLSPDYELDDVSLQFWKSLGRKYPEVCFIEK